MQIRHWDEEDDVEFLLIQDSKTQTTINCTAETVRAHLNTHTHTHTPLNTHYHTHTYTK